MSCWIFSKIFYSSNLKSPIAAQNRNVVKLRRRGSSIVNALVFLLISVPNFFTHPSLPFSLLEKRSLLVQSSKYNIICYMIWDILHLGVSIPSLWTDHLVLLKNLGWYRMRNQLGKLYFTGLDMATKMGNETLRENFQTSTLIVVNS